ncbi:hypothetical protein [Phormidium tenue]
MLAQCDRYDITPQNPAARQLRNISARHSDFCLDNFAAAMS